jgi:Flp pilus assembly protein TadG
MKRERGSALVELSLCLPVLVALFLGGWQFGYSYFIYGSLEQAVRAGARYAAKATYTSTTSTPTAQFQTAVQNMVVYGDPTGTSTQPVAPGLTTSNVSLAVTYPVGVNAPTGFTVAIVNYRMPAAFGNIALNNKPMAWFP